MVGVVRWPAARARETAGRGQFVAMASLAAFNFCVAQMNKTGDAPGASQQRPKTSQEWALVVPRETQAEPKSGGCTEAVAASIYFAVQKAQLLVLSAIRSFCLRK